MYEFHQNMEITYVNSPYAQKNPFLNAEIRLASLPTYDRARSLLPEIVWNGHEDAIACYNKAWEIAFSNLNNPTDGSGFVSPFIDTAFNGNLFMWDSSFILMFAKYASRAFDFQQTLDNFYSISTRTALFPARSAKKTARKCMRVLTRPRQARPFFRGANTNTICIPATAAA